MINVLSCNECQMYAHGACFLNFRDASRRFDAGVLSQLSLN